jgi:hypothetical protein
VCKKWVIRKRISRRLSQLYKCELNGEMRCKQCQRDNKHNHNIPRQNTQEENTQPIFHPTLTIHSHLSIEKRAAIVAFHRIGMDKYKIMKYIACSMPTVNHWIKHYNQHFNVTPYSTLHSFHSFD